VGLRDRHSRRHHRRHGRRPHAPQDGLAPLIRSAFWDGSDHAVLPPLTADAVRDAERVLGVTLPAVLLDLLRVRNGGTVHPTRRRYPTSQPTSWASDHVPFHTVMGLGNAGSGESIMDTPYLVREWGLPEPVVLLTGDGHWWIALDYRACGRRGEPAVTWFDTDLRSELVLAPDFRTFVDGLTSERTGVAG
jgi:SMI1-KNR4 cell-wall